MPHLQGFGTTSFFAQNLCTEILGYYCLVLLCNPPLAKDGHWHLPEPQRGRWLARLMAKECAAGIQWYHLEKMGE